MVSKEKACMTAYKAEACSILSKAVYIGECLTCSPIKVHRAPEAMKNASVPKKPTNRKIMGTCFGKASCSVWPRRKAVIMLATLRRYS